VETRADERVEDVVGERRGLVDLGRTRCDLVLGQLADRLAQHVLLVGEPVQVEVRIPDAHTPDIRTTN
jgi:hypothetical protein